MSDENKFNGYDNENKASSGENVNENSFDNTYGNMNNNTYSNVYGNGDNYGNSYYSTSNLEPKKKNRNIVAGIVAIVAGVILIVSLGMGIGYWVSNNISNREGSVTKNEDDLLTSVDSSGDSKKDSEEPHYTLSKADGIETTDIVQTTVLDVSAIVEEVVPSVVAISSTFEYSTGYQTAHSNGSGTGVILAQDDTEILIVTNAHVIDEESSSSYYYSVDVIAITITFNDGSTAEAYVKGTDTESDLAVIAVKLEDITEETLGNIKVATIGNSNELKMGNGVIAIGNALGYGQSVTVGYVSALNRAVTFSDGYTRNLIQIDAAINPGNSGGGLFDMYGRLIGINESKTVSEEVEGIGFAIPISEAEEIITELMNTVPRVAYSDEERGYMGISSMNVPSSYVASGYPEGAVIVSVVEGSPAAKAGLQIQDIVVGVNDVDVDSSTELVEELSYYAVGDTVILRVMRIERNRFVETEITVTLGDKTVIEDLTEATSQPSEQ